MYIDRVVITEDLVRRANQAAIEGKRYSRDIEDAAAKMPQLTADEINNAWASANGSKKDNGKAEKHRTNSQVQFYL